VAAKDIFWHIAKEQDRVFLIRVSFVKIYNEEVRDLLVSGNTDNVITVREDPQQGEFVNSNENIVTDFESLLGTFLRERRKGRSQILSWSSRSHTIFRIAVENRKISTELNNSETESDSDDENDRYKEKPGEKDDEVVRISTLNLVDLVESKSVKQTGATGDRQKEGGRINRRWVYISY